MASKPSPASVGAGADVRESEPVKPVPEAFVDAIRPHVSRQIWAMVQLQRLSGMRPQEVCMIRTCDVDMSGRVWVFTPQTHKTEHHGRERRIYFGPAAQEILRPWLRPELTAYVFSPREAMGERQAERRRERRTPLTPSQRSRKRKAKPKRSPGERYDTRSYYHGVLYGIRRANREAERIGESDDTRMASEPTPPQRGDSAPSGVRPGRGPGRLGPFLPGRDRGLCRVGRSQSGGGDGAGGIVIRCDRLRNASPGAGPFRPGKHEQRPVYQIGVGEG